MRDFHCHRVDVPFTISLIKHNNNNKTNPIPYVKNKHTKTLKEKQKKEGWVGISEYEKQHTGKFLEFSFGLYIPDL